jgi:hypothetical protein
MAAESKDSFRTPRRTLSHKRTRQSNNPETRQTTTWGSAGSGRPYTDVAVRSVSLVCFRPVPNAMPWPMGTKTLGLAHQTKCHRLCSLAMWSDMANTRPHRSVRRRVSFLGNVGACVRAARGIRSRTRLKGPKPHSAGAPRPGRLSVESHPPNGRLDQTVAINSKRPWPTARLRLHPHAIRLPSPLPCAVTPNHHSP